MAKQLGPRPNLEHLRKQAKELKKSESIPLHEAQTRVAREYGFASWPKLVHEVEALVASQGITPQVELEFCEIATSDDVARLKRLLNLYPGLPQFSEACALVSGEIEVVREIDPGEKLAPLDVWPLEYVAYSRMHRVEPQRYDALLTCARDLLDRGADPNSYRLFQADDPNSKLPVLYGAAGESGHAGIVRLLLERGAEPNDGESIFHAAEHDFEDILEILVEFGADVSARHPGWGNTPLYFLYSLRGAYASGPSALRGMRWLLEHGADPNVPSTDREETPLHHACRLGLGADVISLLLSHGADPSISDSEGNTAYQLAMMTGNKEALQLLEGAYAPLTVDQQFLSACALNDERAIATMVATDLSLCERLQDKAEELMTQFAETNQVSGLRGLLYAGFPVIGKSRSTPLHFACINGLLEPIGILLDHHAPLDIRDEEHDAIPFGWATWGSIFRKHPLGNYPEAVRMLLRAGSSREEAKMHLEWEELGEDVKEAIRG